MGATGKNEEDGDGSEDDNSHDEGENDMENHQSHCPDPMTPDAKKVK